MAKTFMSGKSPPRRLAGTLAVIKKVKMHPLDKAMIKWQKEKEAFYLDTNFSDNYVQIKLPIANKHTWQIKEHNILKSKNLVQVFNEHYRKKDNKGFIPYFDMISAIFKRDFIPSQNIDLGEIIIYPNEKVTDVISGFAGNFGGKDKGLLMSDKLISILQEFNVGNTKTFPVSVNHKGKTYDNFKYFRFISYGDDFIDFDKSILYKQVGFFNHESREVLKTKSLEEVIKLRKELNKDSEEPITIGPKEIFMKTNDIDLFTFSELPTIDIFCSKRLLERLIAENITGFEYIRTTKVKNS